jgi:hypothetical protein
MSYNNILILLFYAVCNNAFLLTHVNKIYFANTKHANRKSKLLLNNINNNNINNTNNASADIFPSFYEFLRTQNIKDDIIEDVETIKADFLNFKSL